MRTYHQVAGEREDRNEDMPTFDSVRTILDRERRRDLPPVPRNIEDVRVEGEWTRTWNGLDFLSLVDNANGLLVFVTLSCLHILAEVSVVFIDGTFKTVPRPYTQLVTLHGRTIGNMFTLAYALMNGKRLEQYRRLLQHLKNIAVDARLRFSPRIVVSDFEVAIRRAFVEEFPGIRVRGCYFHLTQSLWRKIQELGLTNAYNHDNQTQRLIRKVFALGFLPVALVGLNFRILRRSAQAQRVMALYPAVGNFFDYVEATYINGEFPIPTWNVFGRNMSHRTTNVVEGKYTGLQ
nr:uncharacterized protein LOC129263283 [Lytechinus pictus]